eukprot:TRINITY_DN3491_c0_g1_i1.p5 TRINITY_DN3491_c0_g1~~TRINITY_DN3491_c0_g1_i1.p5  ORF type:complete len:54 (-),score=5.65 TRINITY_DN3491_c0_g1_i1:545-706(-)
MFLVRACDECNSPLALISPAAIRVILTGSHRNFHGIQIYGQCNCTLIEQIGFF